MEAASSPLRRPLALAAVIYAGLAGLHTVGDFDCGWLMATGRWALGHLQLPGTDVLSYTTPGMAWHYPSLGGVIFYGIYAAAGYAGLSIFCALVCAGLVGWLTWRTPAGGSTPALLAILAVPSLVYRTTPRADLFTTVLFALLLTVLWRHHYGEKGRLWLLPLLMLLWVNLHPGYVAGLALLGFYLLVELLELPWAELRPDALARLGSAWPWLLGAAAATLVNPWGLEMLRSAATLSTHAGHQSNFDFRGVIGEWSAMRVTPRAMLQAFELHNADAGYWWLLAAAALAALCALGQRRLAAAALLVASAVLSARYLRFQGLFAIVVIVIGSGLLEEALEGLREHEPLRRWLTTAVAAALVLFAMARIGDLFSDRSYVAANDVVDFGVGETWWFPERAAEFIEREQLPKNLFQPFNLGGFTALRLGPEYPDYTDGRGISGEILKEEERLLSSSPDGPVWQQIARERNIQTLFLSLARAGGLEGVNLPAFCQSREWAPVYMDEVSMVLLRRTPRNQERIDRLQLDCSTVTFQPPGYPGKTAQYQFHANAGAVLFALARDAEAERQWMQALALFPSDPNVHLYLAQLCQQRQRTAEAEAHFKSALAARQSAAAWYGLGRLYATGHRWPEAERAIANSAELALRPSNNYKALAQARLKLQQPARALEAIAKAEAAHAGNSMSPDAEFDAQLDEARAEAARQLGKRAEALEWQQKAAQLTPGVASRWSTLAELARSSGDTALESEAVQHVQELKAKPSQAIR